MKEFRVWDKVCNQMILPENNKDIHIYLSGVISIRSMWATRDMVLMQYIGLTDVNNIPICEGDIIKPYGVVTYDKENTKYHCVVNDGLDRDFSGYTRLEIIGNIYEGLFNV